MRAISVGRRAIAAAYLALGASLIAAFYAVGSTAARGGLAAAVPACALLAVLGSVRLFRQRPPLPWLLFGAGLLALVVAELLWAIIDRDGAGSAFPAAADWASAAADPLLLGGAIALLWKSAAGGLWRNVADALASLLNATIVGAAAGFFVWRVAVDVGGAGAHPAKSLFVASFLSVHLVILAALLEFPPVLLRGSRSLQLLAAAFMLLAASHALYGVARIDGSYRQGAWLDSLQLVGSLAIGLTALTPDSVLLAGRPGSRLPLGGWRLAILVGATLLVPVAVSVQAARGELHTATFGSWALFLTFLALARLVVSERAERRARRALAEQERRLRIALESTGAGAWEWSLDSDTIALDVSSGPLLGRPRGFSLVRFEELLALVHPDDRHVLAARRSDAGAGLQVLEFRVLWPDGSMHWLESAAALVEERDGSPRRLVGIARDITARKEAEATSRLAEAQLKAVFEGSRDAIMLLDDRLEIVKINPAGAAYFGRAADECAGRPAAELSSVPTEAIEASFRLLLARGELVTLWRIVDATGKSHIMEVAARANVLPGEHLVVARDVSEQTRLEAEQRQAQKLEAVGRLAGGIAHDFNNLLTVIGGTAELARRTVAGRDPSLEESLEQILAAGDRAGALTRKLLTFSRRQAAEPAPLDLSRTAADLAELLGSLLGDEIQLRIELEPDPPPILADRNEIEQVIMNLAVNACDAMPGGGTITLRTRTTGADRPDPDAGPRCVVELAVIDTGHGMDAETAERALDPFFTTKPPGIGTGLGLSTVHGIVTQAGGSIRIDSEPGRGTTVAVHFPTVAGPAASPSPRAAGRHGEDAPAGRATILLVEDHDDVRRLTRRALEHVGYRVIDVPHPEQALEAIAGGDPVDLLLTDISMPSMNGWELARRARRHQPGVRVMFMSGYAQDAGARAEGDAVIEKPFTLPELADAVARALEQPQAGRGS